jgi:hypothetical protein
VLSRQDVFPVLADGFVCLRLDWEQGNHFKERFGFILGTGDQLILNPQGKVIPTGETGSDGQTNIIYGRHGRDTTGEVLQEIAARHPGSAKTSALDMDWFFWPRHESRRSGGFYPASPDAMASFARLPQAVVSGPLPEALRDPEFLRRHVRQFIWVRASAEGPSRLEVKRVRDGLPDGLPNRLADLRPGDLSPEALGHALDAAWLEYMKDRPLVARGYLDNPHGKWMRSLREQMIYEDEEVRRRAREGTLRPPGRR